MKISSYGIVEFHRSYTYRSYTYNSQDGSLNTMTTALGDTLSHSYDGLRRLSSVTNGLLTRQYSYRDVSDNSTTMQVSRVRYPEFNYNFDYTYDALGNIATYDSPWANPVTYTYDNQSQLLSASDGSTTYTYTYDAAGNIQSASNGTTTHSYTYGDADWKDLLTAFDNQSITYDASGNPTSYFNGKRWTMSWVNGRQLASASDGTSTYSYIYDAAGSRIMKNVGTVNHLYFYVNGMLLMEYRYNAMGDTTDVLQYFYDANGKPHAMAYNGTVYLYVTNLQGDIVALLGLDGTVSGYEYDPYGNVIASYGDIAAINPRRYRGYYYDNETGLYYLQSRYYDPVVGRFINADSYSSTGQGILGNNMFAYCGNNPIVRKDADGEAFETALDVISLAASAAELAANPTDLWALASFSGDLIDVLLPFVSGVGETVKVVSGVVKVSSAVDDVHDTVKTAKRVKTSAKVHGNSLSTTKVTFGYELRSVDTNEIMKFGETTRGSKRYTNKYYTQNRVYMNIVEVGTKREMHTWQHKKILQYFDENGRKPLLNKSFW